MTNGDDLTIVLDSSCANKIYYPGDRVYGTVISRVPPADFQDACVIFKGILRTSITHSNGQSQSTAHDSIDLFRFTTPLYMQDATCSQPNLYEWLFDFVFPISGSYTRVHGFMNSTRDPPIEVLLPPTFNTQNFRKPSRSNKGFVVYTVKVKVNSKRLFGSRETKQELFLRQVSTPQHQDDALKSHEMTSCYWHSSDLRPQQHTFKEKMKHAFSSDPNLKTPTICFRPRISIPNAMTMTQTCPVTISIAHRITSPTDPENPTIILKEIWFEMGNRVWLRAGRHGRENKYHEQRTTFRQINQPMPLDGSVVTAIPRWSLSTIDPHSPLVADFDTPLAVHTHSLKMGATFVHLESGHVFEADVKEANFVILPERSTGMAPLMAPALEEGCQQGKHDSGMPAPDYNPVEGSASNHVYPVQEYTPDQVYGQDQGYAQAHRDINDVPPPDYNSIFDTPLVAVAPRH